MEKDIKKLALEWCKNEKGEIPDREYYCETRDVFEARNDKTPEMLIRGAFDENVAYLIYSMLGELGNNSFDHNLGNWPDVKGVFFSVEYDGEKGVAVIADRGLGVLSTLKKVAPNLANDQEAVELAFTK